MLRAGGRGPDAANRCGLHIGGRHASTVLICPLNDGSGPDLKGVECIVAADECVRDADMSGRSFF